MTDRPIFHAGELDAQRRAGEQEVAARVARMIQPTIVEGAIPFLRQQPMLIAGSEDSSGRIWASVLYGRPGFLDPSEDGKKLRIHLDRSWSQGNDPLLENLSKRPDVGLLVVEFSSRRRLKVNGPVERSGNVLTVDVAESYAICPKYIQKRDIQTGPANSAAHQSDERMGSVLEDRHLEQIGRSDTFFVASSHASYGPDVSHRGGKPGFVKLLPDRILRIPDFRGNSMLCSFGNFTINPNAGLVFVDYESRKILQLSGKASLYWDQPDADRETGGTNRFWEFRTELWLENELPEAVHERFFEYSPFNP